MKINENIVTTQRDFKRHKKWLMDNTGLKAQFNDPCFNNTCGSVYFFCITDTGEFAWSNSVPDQIPNMIPLNDETMVMLKDKYPKEDPVSFCTENSEELRKRLEDETSACWNEGGKPTEFDGGNCIYFNHAVKNMLTQDDLFSSTRVTSDEFVRLVEKACPRLSAIEQKEELIAVQVERDELLEFNCNIREANVRLVEDYSAKIKELEKENECYADERCASVDRIKTLQNRLDTITHISKQD